MKRYWMFLLIIFMAGSYCSSGPQFVEFRVYKKHKKSWRSSKNRWKRPSINKFNSSQKIRVLIHSGSLVKVSTKGSYSYTDNSGRVYNGNGSILVANEGVLKTNSGYFILNKKKYYGELKIHKKGKSYLYVNYVPLPEYLVSVVGHEMSPSWPVEALKAQAIVARTYVRNKIESKAKTQPKAKYDIGNTTADQVYGGVLKREMNVRAAIEETRNKVITYQGKLAQVFYHSCCGGETAASDEVWNKGYPYLIRKRCEFKESPEYKWEAVYSIRNISKLFKLPGLRSVKVFKRSKSKRVKSLKFQSRRGSKVISAAQFRRKLGASKVRSTRFAIRNKGRKLIVRGRGYGHGVGLCQWCAKIMVEKRSANHRRIIRFFFPGTKITKIRKT